jgi:hypothetical protein
MAAARGRGMVRPHLTRIRPGESAARAPLILDSGVRCMQLMCPESPDTARGAKCRRRPDMVAVRSVRVRADKCRPLGGLVAAVQRSGC